MLTDKEHLLLLLKENPSLTQVELSEMMEMSGRTVQVLMQELLDEGVIERVGSKKKGSWLVKKSQNIPKSIKRTWSDGKYDALYELMG